METVVRQEAPSLDTDTGLAQRPHRLVAVYETRVEAEAVRHRLIVAGVDPSAIIVANEAPDGDIGVNPTDSFAGKSFWGKLRDLLAIAPAHERHAYEEAVTRGHGIVILSPPAPSLDRMVALLEATNPIDFNARQQDWHRGGWRNPAQADDPAGSPIRGYDASNEVPFAPTIRAYRTDHAPGLKPPAPRRTSWLQCTRLTPKQKPRAGNSWPQASSPAPWKS